MSDIITRNPRIGEVPALRDMWGAVFGDVGAKSFFEYLFDSELCVIAEVEGAPAAMGYLIPTGEVVYGAEAFRCAMIYSVATLPKYRGRGFGTAVVHKLISLAREIGYPAIVLCPTDDDLFEYYKAHSELREWFYVNEIIIDQAPANTNPALLTDVSATEYHSQREVLLKGTVHIRQDLHIFEYQSLLCKELGGGLFRIGNSYAVVERQPDGAVWVKEYLSPGGSIGDSASGPDFMNAISSIMHKFPSHTYVVRSLSRISEGRRFGMIAFSDIQKFDLCENATSPWYGMAFD